MSGFFNLDGPFYKYGTLLADIMILTILWIVFSIPLFTMGASTTALYYVMTKRANEKDSYVVKDFWKSFKTNFKNATILWLLIVFVFGIVITNILNIHIMGNMASIFLPLEIVMCVELFIISLYMFPMLSRFEMGRIQLIKAAFVLGNRHILTTIICLILGVGIIIAVIQWPFLVILAMGLYAYLTSFFLMKIFKKYRPEIDKDETYDDFAESRRTQRALEAAINDSEINITNNISSSEKDDREEN